MSNNSNKKNKLTLDDFKIKSSLNGSKEALDAITGGILGACHDSTGSGTSGGGTGSGTINVCSTYLGGH